MNKAAANGMSHQLLTCSRTAPQYLNVLGRSDFHFALM